MCHFIRFFVDKLLLLLLFLLLKSSIWFFAHFALAAQVDKRSLFTFAAAWAQAIFIYLFIFCLCKLFTNCQLVCALLIWTVLPYACISAMQHLCPILVVCALIVRVADTLGVPCHNGYLTRCNTFELNDQPMRLIMKSWQLTRDSVVSEVSTFMTCGFPA